MKNKKLMTAMMGVALVPLYLIGCSGETSNTLLKPEYANESAAVSSSKGSSSSKTGTSAATSVAASSSIASGTSTPAVTGSSDANASSGASSSSAEASSSSVVATENDIVLNEVFPDGVSGVSCDYVELYNKSSADYTVANSQDWMIQDGTPNIDTLYLDAGTVIPAHGFVAFCTKPISVGTASLPSELMTVYRAPTTGFGLSGSSDMVQLYYQKALKDEYVWTAAPSAAARIPDGAASWTVPATSQTPNATNGN